MIEDFIFRKCNLSAHEDIENDIQTKKDGLFTIILRINNTQVTDYTVIDHVQSDKYISLEQEIIEELTASYNSEEGNGKLPIRSTNSERGVKGRSGTA
jgi:hypothetical protein